jgi:uncharacterized protein involved in exopolysaccharide biosynthesis
MSWVEVFVRQEVPARLDVVRSLLLELSLSPVLQDLARRAIAALDRERAEHEKEVAALKQRISELEAQLQDDRKEPSHDWR